MLCGSLGYGSGVASVESGTAVVPRTGLGVIWVAEVTGSADVG